MDRIDSALAMVSIFFILSVFCVLPILIISTARNIIDSAEVIQEEEAIKEAQSAYGTDSAIVSSSDSMGVNESVPTPVQPEVEEPLVQDVVEVQESSTLTRASEEQFRGVVEDEVWREKGRERWQKVANYLFAKDLNWVKFLEGFGLAFGLSLYWRFVFLRFKSYKRMLKRYEVLFSRTKAISKQL